MPAANTSCDPVPVPVVNEVADAVAQALVDTRDENVAMWKDSEILKDVVAYLTEAVCESPQVRAAFEAQAKLEAGELVPANIRSEALRELMYAAKAVWAHRDQFDDQRWERLGLALNRWQVEEGGEL